MEKTEKIKNEPKIEAKTETGSYWVDKSITCNGCKFLNFHKRGCRRNQPQGKVKPLSTYLNADNYVAVLKPADCTYKKEQAEQKEQKKES